MTYMVRNRLPAFRNRLLLVMDEALREGARDTLILAKTRAPFKQGQLRGQTDTKRAGLLKWRVSFWMEYARFQEFGGDSKRRVRRYSTSGTGKKYLKSSGDQVSAKIALTFRKHAARVR